MLTLKLLRENPEFVISKLAVKHFDAAREVVEKVLDLDAKRRNIQTELDACLAQQKQKAALIGGLMKQGKKEEAEAAKAEVAVLKARSAELQSEKDAAETEQQAQLVLLPNLPCDLVPEGRTAEDNVVV
ncbi:MAG: serine--tRNA ligase, partial [Bacteroidales bacterium]|nr:serine--tRNA ligase [Bacteroidales bacterium]